MAGPSSNAGSQTPDVGTVIGRRYRVVRRIGEGGMGVVVEAENVVTGKRVAIKWMHPEVAARPEAAERFLREARASARVRHPNVVDVYDAVHEDDACFLVMELLEGEPLSLMLERGGMPVHEVIALLLDAMRGVVAAHKQGVIHRDIKPDNIFLATESDRAPAVPKVLDFGISKVIGAELMSLTRTGATMGTPMYMSYEQLCGVKDIDVRTDVYAFGVVLYEALTGRPPFEAANLPQLVAKMTHTQPATPRALRPDIPDRLDRVIQRAMSKERESRFSSLGELIEQLEPFASPHAFHQQLTAASAVLPVLTRRERAKANAAAALLVSGRDSAPIATPMEANVPIPSAPRKREALPWLVALGVIATLIGVLTAYGVLQPAAPADATAAAAVGGGAEPAAASEAAKPQAAAPLDAAKQDPSGAKLQAKLKAKPSELRAAAAASGPAKSAVAAPAAAARPGVAAANVRASPGVTPASGAPAGLTERAITLPGARAASAAGSGSHATAANQAGLKPAASPAAAASASEGAGAVQTQKRPAAADSAAESYPAAESQRPTPQSEARRFRAGRPRTEDF